MKFRNEFSYTNSNKRYYTLDYFYKNYFKSKVFKVSLNAGFTCPNIDGTVGHNGCIYCLNGSGDKLDLDLVRQFNEVKNKLSKKWKNGKYIAYFQANSNTYAKVEVLKQKYEPILKLDSVVGLAIATRSDCISDEVLDYLDELNKKTFLVIELGLQTIHEKTAKLINRCHSLENFEEMVKKLNQRNIRVTVHIINGLPYETEEMMLDTVRYLNKLNIWGIKIHMLNILKNTPLEKLYQTKKFHLLTKEEYVNITYRQIRLLKPNIVINRLTSDNKEENLIAPLWVNKKFTVLNDIDKKLYSSNTYQGFDTSILNRSRQLMSTYLKDNDLVIDATIGNGKDANYLLSFIKKGFLFGFDIQQEAITNTNNLLKERYHNYKLFKESHENMYKLLKEYQNKISLIVFNLGYIPKGNQNITTNYKSTIKAIKEGLKLLNNKGRIVITVYKDHDNGKESKNIDKFVETLTDYKVKKYQNTDNPKAPYAILIDKVKK